MESGIRKGTKSTNSSEKTTKKSKKKSKESDKGKREHSSEKSSSLSILKEWITNKKSTEDTRGKKQSITSPQSQLKGQSRDISAFDNREFSVKNWKEYLEAAKRNYLIRRSKTTSPPVNKSDFELLKTLGSGAFSKVMLIRYTINRQFYAAKVMIKAILVRDKHVQHAFNEKQILQCIRFAFTIHLEYFFQDNVYLFYILPFVAGGELFAYLAKVNRIKEDVARFYAAQMLLALEYLHHMGLVFRDLKPENILLDHKGYLKLADFGFCKAVNERTYTFCGTAEYLAPEMINCKGYGRSVDWWTLGILTFEMVAGYTPFYSKSLAKTYDNITKCRYKMPFYFSNDLRDLLKNILQSDLSRRFGILKNGVNDIKEHKWFSSIPWIVLVNRQIKAPYIPLVTRPDDTSNFDPQLEEPLEDATYDQYKKEFAHF